MNDEIYQERRRIAYRLIGRLAIDEIAHVTELSFNEVSELQTKRAEDDKKKIIWTKHHERGAIKMMEENLEHLNKMIEEEADENKKKRFEQHRDKKKRELEERETNLYETRNELDE